MSLVATYSDNTPCQLASNDAKPPPPPLAPLRPTTRALSTTRPPTFDHQTAFGTVRGHRTNAATIPVALLPAARHLVTSHYVLFASNDARGFVPLPTTFPSRLTAPPITSPSRPTRSRRFRVQRRFLLPAASCAAVFLAERLPLASNDAEVFVLRRTHLAQPLDAPNADHHQRPSPYPHHFRVQRHAGFPHHPQITHTQRQKPADATPRPYPMTPASFTRIYVSFTCTLTLTPLVWNSLNHRGLTANSPTTAFIPISLPPSQPEPSSPPQCCRMLVPTVPTAPEPSTLTSAPRPMPWTSNCSTTPIDPALFSLYQRHHGQRQRDYGTAPIALHPSLRLRSAQCDLDNASLAMPQVLTSDARTTRENFITRVDRVNAPSSSAPTETTPASHRTPTSFYVSTSTEVEKEETHSDQVSTAEQQAEGIIVESSASPVAVAESAVPEPTQSSTIPAQNASQPPQSSPVALDIFETAAQEALTAPQSETTPLDFHQATPPPSPSDELQEEYPTPSVVSERGTGNDEAFYQNYSQINRPVASLDQNHPALQLDAAPSPQDAQTLTQTSAPQPVPFLNTHTLAVEPYPGAYRYYHPRCGHYNAGFPTAASPSPAESHSGSLPPVPCPSTAATTPTAESPVDGDSEASTAEGAVTTKRKGKERAKDPVSMIMGPYASRIRDSDIPKDASGFGSWKLPSIAQPTTGSSSLSLQYQVPIRFEATSGAPVAQGKRKRDSEEQEREHAAKAPFECSAADYTALGDIDGDTCLRQFSKIDKAFFDHLYGDHQLFRGPAGGIRCPYSLTPCRGKNYGSQKGLAAHYAENHLHSRLCNVPSCFSAVVPKNARCVVHLGKNLPMSSTHFR
ncbi:hypothetical protein DFP72DRAFT_1070144 [Ephemerocybe angulata]|uniref:Uncharacterized protein n=1 Tax=Ephemerocybe angulata TaxID=980116 RepID=A0A8H6HVI5_9AGAR|nr:hypothetical protein DFP72DRAFT_1070144 [Tulosesus angulatus]